MPISKQNLKREFLNMCSTFLNAFVKNSNKQCYNNHIWEHIYMFPFDVTRERGLYTYDRL